MSEPIDADATQGDSVEHQRSHPGARHGDVLGRATWAGIIILAGLVFLADNLGYLPAARNADAWNWIMLGAGGLMLLEALIRAVSVDYQGPSIGGLILGVVLLGLGASAIFGISISGSWWPVILIILGISILTRGMRG